MNRFILPRVMLYEHKNTQIRSLDMARPRTHELCNNAYLKTVKTSEHKGLLTIALRCELHLIEWVDRKKFEQR